jgi:hypothetical protein
MLPAMMRNRLLARGSISVVCVDQATFRPRPIPDELLTCIKTPHDVNGKAHPDLYGRACAPATNSRRWDISATWKTSLQ